MAGTDRRSVGKISGRGGMASNRHLPLVPAAGFVLVWSSGYIAGPYGVEAMSPLMLVALRPLAGADGGRRAAEAHELYRVRELVETPRYAHAG